MSPLHDVQHDRRQSTRQTAVGKVFVSEPLVRVSFVILTILSAISYLNHPPLQKQLPPKFPAVLDHK